MIPSKADYVDSKIYLLHDRLDLLELDLTEDFELVDVQSTKLAIWLLVAEVQTSDCETGKFEQRSKYLIKINTVKE